MHHRFSRCSARTLLESVSLALVTTLLVVPPALEGQEAGGADASFFPGHASLLTGYGAASYAAVLGEDGTPNNFGALLAPIFLFQISDRFLFEGEVEFELEEGVTATSLEYAQIDFTLTNNLKVTAGKLLLPFNVFSERYHPTWINPMVSPPAVYGHHGGAGPTDPLLPILSDIGAQVRGTFNVGRFGYVTAEAFASQGPAVEEEHADEENADEAEEEEHAHVPELVFGSNTEDNNQGKMFGARLGFGVAPYLEVNLSGMTAEYDDAGTLGFTGYGAHVEARHRGFTLHGEWILTRQDVASEDDPSEIDVLDRTGYWLHLGRRFGPWQPQLRWTQVFDGDVHGETAVPGGEQFGLGLVYWFQPSVALKAEYLLNLEEDDVDNDRLAVQWAFGF